MITSATRLCRLQMWLFTGFCTLELSHMQFVIIWKVFMIMIIRATHLLNHSFIHLIVEKAFRDTFHFCWYSQGLIFNLFIANGVFRSMISINRSVIFTNRLLLTFCPYCNNVMCIVCKKIYFHWFYL